MNYQLYNIDEKNTTKYLVKTRTGYRMSATKATEFTYEEAIQLQNEVTKFGVLEMCNENDEHIYIYKTKYDYWKRYIPEDDALYDDKHYALDAACDLCYKDTTLEAIINANTIGEINRAMKNERIA